LEKTRNLIDVFESSTAIMIVGTPNKKVIYVNKGFEKLTKMISKDIVGKSCRVFCSKHECPIIDLGFDVDSVECVIKTPTGKIPVMKSVYFSKENHFIVENIVAISKQKQIQNEKIQNQKFEIISNISSRIAHEFNNVLMILLGNTQLLQDEKISPKMEELLKEMENIILETAKLTKELKIFSKEHNPIRKLHDISEILHNSIILLFRGSRCGYEINIEKDLPLIEIDKIQIKQVINNVIINAIQSMPSGGHVKISVSKKKISQMDNIIKIGNYLLISIEDKGIGIREENLKKIFIPYFTTKKNGTGLGLPISQAILSKHNGNITFDSKIGVGTNFFIYLPINNENKGKKNNTSNKSPEELEKKIPEINSQKNVIQILNINDNKDFNKDKRILVMEDDKIIQNILSKILNRAGYETTICSNGEECISKYSYAYENGKSFDLILMDYTISDGISGDEAIRLILDFDPEAKVILSSGHYISDYKKQGFRDMIQKPYSAQKILQIIEDNIDYIQ
jgi:nitrogen-specific signal transduction histidine kinase/CheY-like chemotaxis protein